MTNHTVINILSYTVFFRLLLLTPPVELELKGNHTLGPYLIWGITWWGRSNQSNLLSHQIFCQIILAWVPEKSKEKHRSRKNREHQTCQNTGWYIEKSPQKRQGEIPLVMVTKTPTWVCLSTQLAKCAINWTLWGIFSYLSASQQQ